MGNSQVKAAVGYARRSTELQERSIPDQQAYVEKWAREHGYIIKRWFIDDAISGTSTRDRDEFERMIAEAENGRDFEAILTYDISRFSRGGTNETGFYLHRLKLVGVEAVFCAEGIPEGDEGELLQGVKSWQARQYSVKLSRDCIRGQISTLLERRSAPGGAPPFGYDKRHVTAGGQVLRTFRNLSDGRKEEYDSASNLVRVLSPGETVKKAKRDIVVYVPSTAERVAVVRRAFDLARAGYGGRSIADRLNNDGVAAPDGGKWNGNQLRRMLVNPVYKGWLAWNRKTEGKLNGVDRNGTLRPRRGNYRVKANARADWYLVEDVHEPLIPVADFDQTQAVLDGRRTQGGLAKQVNRSLLSGLIVCTRCGWNFGQWRHSASTQGGGKRHQYRYYVDRGYHTGGKSVCKSTLIPADALDAWVIESVRKAWMGSDQNLAAAAERFIAKVLADCKPESSTPTLERDLEAVSRRIKATISMISDPTFDGLDELKTTLAGLKAKRDELEAKAKKAQPAVPLKESDLRQWATEYLELLKAVLAGQATAPEARRLIHSAVNRIEIDPQAQSGTLFLADDPFMVESSTRGTFGEYREREKYMPRLNP